MRNFITKFIVAFLSFVIGISAFYLSRAIVSSASFDNSTARVSETSLPMKELSGNIEIRFVRFVQGEPNVEAEFEVTNGRAEDVYYSGYNKNNIAFPILKRGGKIVQDNRFRCGTGLVKQTLASGETVLIRVSKSEVTYDPTSQEETDKPTQLGFSIFIGEHFIELGERRKEIIWTEEIKFPN